MKRIFVACCVFVMSFALMGDNRQAWADEFDDDSGLDATDWATISVVTLLTTSLVVGGISIVKNNSHYRKGTKSRGWAITSYVTNGINTTIGVGLVGAAVLYGVFYPAPGGVFALGSIPFLLVGIWGLHITSKAVRYGRPVGSSAQLLPSRMQLGPAFLRGQAGDLAPGLSLSIPLF